MHIAFYDSGLGGLTVAKAFLDNLRTSSHDNVPPLRHLSYIADTHAYPYGDKSSEWLLNRASSIIHAFLDTTFDNPPDIIVIACNTASTLVLDQLRARFAQPFVGVVPAVKPAATLSTSGVIGVFATQATVARDYTAQLIKNYAPHCRVNLFATEQLVHTAELKLLEGVVDQAAIAAAIAPLASIPSLDTVVLACTHFPLLREDLESAAPHLQWVDSGAAVARRIRTLAAVLDAPSSVHREQYELPAPVFTLATTGGVKEQCYRDRVHSLLAYLQIENAEYKPLGLSID